MAEPLVGVVKSALSADDVDFEGYVETEQFTLTAHGLGEFQRDLADVDDAALRLAFLSLGDNRVGLRFSVRRSDAADDSVGLKVEGENRTLVEGVLPQAKELVDKKIEEVRREAEEEQQRLADERSGEGEIVGGSSTHSLAAAPPWWQNLWFVTVAGGVAAALIAGVILWLILD
jgi:hypothetical protein